MCEILSVSVTRNGQVLAILGENRWKLIFIGENPDSHTLISRYFNVKEDETWKYEMPINRAHPPKTPEELLETLVYNGGLPEEEIHTTQIKAIENWVKENWDKIKEIPLIPFVSIV